jgi:hypothetical protein
MAASIPTVEPTSARAGDTWAWTRESYDYPAPSWVLTYTLYSSAAVISFAAAADGTIHSVSLAPATTAAYTAGRYDWVAHVTDGTDRYQVASGVITVLPDVAEAATYDGRSHARKMLDAINALIEGRATAGDLDVVRTSTGDRATDWDLPSLMKLRQQYAQAVRAEDDAARLIRGERPSRFIATRFVG